MANTAIKLSKISPLKIRSEPLSTTTQQERPRASLNCNTGKSCREKPNVQNTLLHHDISRSRDHLDYTHTETSSGRNVKPLIPIKRTQAIQQERSKLTTRADTVR